MSNLHAPWREAAACSGHPYPELWDLDVEGEDPATRPNRHAAAATICESCPVRNQCLADVDRAVDEGVRGGVLIQRRAPVRAVDRREIVHGTMAGHRAHFRQNQTPPCSACRDAFNRYKQDQRARLRTSA